MKGKELERARTGVPFFTSSALTSAGPKALAGSFDPCDDGSSDPSRYRVKRRKLSRFQTYIT